ncbi:hypothetical protein [Leisingera methylohalidivorans]|uniref:hypothetical protein n=1 Tax=Leisingera methylohalidivorans TaxID=133924 RepID=UPI001FE216A9|nr:hypothetical protein [Leisingera methylohalidivorans]
MAEALKPLQSTLLFNPMFKPQVEQFWNVQERILDEAELFARHWFERRHEATRTALDAARTAVSGEPLEPAAAMEAFSEWRRHSAERIAEDGREWFGMMSRCASYASKTEAEAVGEAAEEAVKITNKATKPVQSEPV